MAQVSNLCPAAFPKTFMRPRPREALTAPSGRAYTQLTMRAVLAYLRGHRWQRRAVTLSLAAIVGVLSAWAIWPVLRDMKILSLLASDDPLQRERGVAWAVEVAQRRGQLIQRLERRIPSAGDVEFVTIAEVLNRLGRFETPDRPPEEMDRWRAVNFALAGGEREARLLRRLLLGRLIRTGGDNAHVRRALALAAGDEEPAIRADAGMLAARLGDDQALAKLLSDADAQVRASAALDAALGGRAACLPAIAARLPESADDERASAAYALARLCQGEARLRRGEARLAPDQHAQAVLACLREALRDGKDALAERLLHAATLLPPDLARPAVLEVLRDASRSGKPPALDRGGQRPAPPGPLSGALIAAGRLEIPEARPLVTEVITAMLARDRSTLTLADARTLAAGVQAARRLHLPPKVFLDVIGRLWHPGTSQAMLLAAEALGEAEARSPGSTAPAEVGATAPARTTSPASEQVKQILRGAVAYEGTPVPSAAAAVALFRLDPDNADEALRTACESETWLAGDYVAWNLAHLARDPRLSVQVHRIARAWSDPREYNDGVRSAGVMLAAFLARGTQEGKALAAGMEQRLARMRQRPFIAGTYQCALLTLGRQEFAEPVAALARAEAFPKSRALTSLVLAGRAEGFDIVFQAEEFDAATVDSFLTGRLMWRVCSGALPDVSGRGLPAFDIEAPTDLRLWQAGILRRFWLIHRRAILDRMRP